MKKVIKTKNYFLGLLYLLLAVIFTVFFLSIGLIVVAFVLIGLVAIYIIFGISYLFHKIKKKF